MPVKIVLTGDVMLGRIVNEFIAQFGPEYVWGDVLPLLQSADFSLINLECAITKHTQPWPEEKAFYFRADPQAIEVLKAAKIKCVNLANNHALDFREEGLLETLQLLKEANIAYTGAGKNLEEAQKPAMVNIKDLKIGLLGFSDNEPGFAAKENKPGINFAEIDTNGIETLAPGIREARKKVDLLIATAHWGPNMRAFPDNNFIFFAQTLRELGVDIFHGHSAHLFQGIELFQGKTILYDTGDFVDDYMVDNVLRNDLSFLYMLTLEKNKIEKIELFPVYISRCQVNRAYSWLQEECYRLLSERGAPFGTKLIKKEDRIEVKLD